MYPQSMFFSRNKKNNVYPYKPQFYYIKVGFKRSKLYRHVFVMCLHFTSFPRGGLNRYYVQILCQILKKIQFTIQYYMNLIICDAIFHNFIVTL